jgi:hypothetical protein
MGVKVFWAARDLAGSPWGNHHFILICFKSNYSFPRILTKKEGGVNFITLGGFKNNGNLVFTENEASDVQSVKEVIDPSMAGAFSDFDMEYNRVTAPSGGEWAFAQTLVDQAFNFKRNTATSPVPFDLRDSNCAAWVNTMFKIAGVSAATRLKAGEFSGMDWAEEDEIAASLFK